MGTARDGVLGPITLAAINDMDSNKFVDDICDMRLRFMRGLHTWSTFGKGWSARVADLRAYCHRVAGAAPSSAKALHEEDVPTS